MATFDWQNTLAIMIVALTIGYLAIRTAKWLLRGQRGACGSCGGCAATNEQHFAGKAEIIQVESLVESARQQR